MPADQSFMVKLDFTSFAWHRLNLTHINVLARLIAARVCGQWQQCWRLREATNMNL
jgi:hypothetical protein